MTVFLIVRHGESEWNHPLDRYCGRTDIPLNEQGQLQAKKVAEGLRHVAFDSVYSSPLHRAVETAGWICTGRDLQIETDDRLIEMDFGKWEGLIKEDIINKNHQYWTDWLSSPENVAAGITGETAVDVFQRASSFFLEKHRQFPKGTVLVVTHSTLIRILICGTLNMPYSKYRSLRVDNTGISVMELRSDRDIRWLKMNETAHLRT